MNGIKSLFSALIASSALAGAAHAQGNTINSEADYSPLTDAEIEITEHHFCNLMGVENFIVIDQQSAEYLQFENCSATMRVPALMGELREDFNIVERGVKATNAGIFNAYVLTHEDYAAYPFQTAIIFQHTKDRSFALAVHGLWLGEPSENREERISTPDPSDNFITNGCVNLENNNFAATVRFMHRNYDRITGRYPLIAVLPDNRSGVDLAEWYQSYTPESMMVETSGHYARTVTIPTNEPS